MKRSDGLITMAKRMKSIPARWLIWPLKLALLWPAAIAQGGAKPSSQAPPPTPASGFANIDAIMDKAVAEGNIPGGVVLVGHNGAVIYRKAFGMRSLEPAREPMTVDTIFDLASLTKCIATTTAMMQLIERGQIRLNDPVATYLPEFAQNGKGNLTVRELMTHFS